MLTLLLLSLQADSAAQAAELLKTLEKAQPTFYKIDPDSEDRVPAGRKKLHRWAVLQEKPLADPDAAAVRAVLADKAIHGDIGAKCFTPGLAFRFLGEGEPIDFIICLECRWIRVYRGKDMRHSWALSKDGVAALTKLYQQHADPEAKK